MERLIWNSSGEESQGRCVWMRWKVRSRGRKLGCSHIKLTGLVFLGEMEERAFARAGLRRMVMKV